ncbi:MAG TPA: hypothetical protein VNJ01_11770 [Bacteriovoracaceae bacterium]|nr:hypothetical protein [Bacteriovoracaceae bacterium]
MYVGVGSVRVGSVLLSSRSSLLGRSLGLSVGSDRVGGVYVGSDRVGSDLVGVGSDLVGGS